MRYRNARTAEAVARFWGKTLREEERRWYDIQALNEDEAEIRIYDVIGWPFITADEFARDVLALQAEHITVAINSPGGDVFDGTAIYNTIRRHPANITTRIDGLAASMASIIALAGDEVQIAENAYYMIHNPWTWAIGDEHNLRKEADIMSRIGSSLADTYAQKTGKSAEDIKGMMDAESWFVGGEAEEAGFADRVIGESMANARFVLGMYANAPRSLNTQARSFAENPPSKKEFERLLRESGFSRSQALAIAGEGFSAISQCDTDRGVLEAMKYVTRAFVRGCDNE